MNEGIGYTRALRNRAVAYRRFYEPGDCLNDLDTSPIRRRVTALLLMLILGLGVIGFLAAGSAQAAGVGVRAGTTGIGGDVGWSVAPTLNARIGYSALSWNHHLRETDVRYNAKLKLSNLSALLDWSPLGPFRLTGGIVGNNNKYDLSGTPSGGTFTVNGTTYQASDVGNFGGTIKSGKSLVPYLGVGYGNVAGMGVNFYFDLGVMLQGSPKASLSANCGSALSASQCAQLQSDVAAEGRNLQDSLKRFKYYPVANIGITIGF
jgi:hypothetical protein